MRIRTKTVMDQMNAEKPDDVLADMEAKRMTGCEVRHQFMTIREMTTKYPNRSTLMPESLFEVKSYKGEKLLLCWESFRRPEELESILKLHPELMEYEVTKPTFTQEELDASSYVIKSSKS